MSKVRRRQKAFLFRTDRCVLAALEVWAADGRSVNKQIEFILLRALYRRGIDPTDHHRGAVIPPLDDNHNLAGYLDATRRLKAVRRPQGEPADEGGQRATTSPLRVWSPPPTPHVPSPLAGEG